MKICQCLNCGHGTEITIQNTTRSWHVRGYDYEYWVYHVKCPKCRKSTDVQWKQLPFRVKWNFLFGKR